MIPLVLCEGLKTREQFEVGVLVFQELLKFSAKCQEGWEGLGHGDGTAI